MEATKIRAINESACGRVLGEAMRLRVEAMLEGLDPNPETEAVVLGARVVRVAEDVFLLPGYRRGEHDLAGAAAAILGGDA